MKQHILMVYPKVPATYWSFTHALKFTQARAVMPPLGLMTIAAMIPDNYIITLVDLNVENLTDIQIQEADIVLISAMIVQKESFTTIVDRCRAFGKKIAAGGPYPTSSYQKISGVDYFILNEGEITFPRFLSDYENGTPRHLYMSDDKPDITQSPVPRFDIIDHKNYSSIAVQNSRGCPFNCEFCDIIEMFGRVPRYKDPRQVYRELEEIYKTGFRDSIFIVDDNFIGNKNKAKELLLHIILFQVSHRYPFLFYTEASIDLAQDDELLELMVDAGFAMVFVGIETPDNEILNSTNKKQNTKQDLMSSVDIIQRKGIQVLAGFILGFDNETPDIFDRQIEFIQKAAIPHAMIGLMLALPNTQLYRRLAGEGRILSDSKGNNTHEMELNFIPTLPVDTLTAGYKRVIKTIYSPKAYFKRGLSMIEKMPAPRYTLNSIQIDKLTIFFRSFFVQLFSSYGLIYFGYLLKGFISFPYHAFTIVEIAVKGHHFFKITNEILHVAHCMDKMKKIVGEFEKKLSRIRGKCSQGNIYAYRNKIMKRLTRIAKSQKSTIQKALESYLAEYSDYTDKLVRRNVTSYR